MAEGYYHLYNFLKFRIAEALFLVYPGTLTCNELGDELGVPSGSISRIMCYYHERGYGYFRRMKVKHSKAFRYKLNKKGHKAYRRYLHRIRLGFDLNPNHPPIKMSTFCGLRKLTYKTKNDFLLPPEKYLPYLGITLQGAREFGLTERDLLKVAGIIREFEESEEELGESDELEEPEPEEPVTVLNVIQEQELKETENLEKERQQEQELSQAQALEDQRIKATVLRIRELIRNTSSPIDLYYLNEQLNKYSAWLYHH